MKPKHVFATLLLLACSTPSVARPQDSFEVQLLQAHNLERRLFQDTPMVWDVRLASDADAYAAELSRTGRWGHSPPERRVGQGENLWTGTRAAFNLASMVREWTDEKRFFRSGVFPNVSRSGSWHDVGHYTQIVWPTTIRVGCGLRSSRDWDYLVCRYANPGNVIGDWLGVNQFAVR
jgi:hypothetical protein